jgi:hypothetical protein
MGTRIAVEFWHEDRPRPNDDRCRDPEMHHRHAHVVYKEDSQSRA